MSPVFSLSISTNEDIGCPTIDKLERDSVVNTVFPLRPSDNAPAPAPPSRLLRKYRLFSDELSLIPRARSSVAASLISHSTIERRDKDELWASMSPSSPASSSLIVKRLIQSDSTEVLSLSAPASGAAHPPPVHGKGEKPSLPQARSTDFMSLHIAVARSSLTSLERDASHKTELRVSMFDGGLTTFDWGTGTGKQRSGK